MRTVLEFYEPPPGQSPNLGRFFDDLGTALSALKGDDRRYLLSLTANYLPKLAEMDQPKLSGYLAKRGTPWKTFGQAEVYKTADFPCVFFAVSEYEDAQEVRIHALGAAGTDRGTNWEELLRLRCESLGLCR